MPPIRRRAAALAALLAACASSAQRRPAPATPRAAGAATVEILHFNDVYEIGPVEGGASGGLARVATLRARLRAGAPGLLTTLGGDYLSPSALGTARVGGRRLDGRQMVAALNALGLDVAVLGNHEFDVPEASFRAHLAQARFVVLAANVADSAGRPLPGVRPHHVATVRAGGRLVRVAFIGVVIPSNPRPWVRYADPVATARDHARRLRDSADVLVALTHLGVADDARLAAEAPELDLVLGGHEHENYTLRRGPRLTPVLKADANARTLQVVRVRVTPGARPAVTSRLETVTAAVPEDPAVARVVAAYTDSAHAGFAAAGFAPRALVAVAPVPLDGRESTVRGGGAGALTDLIGAAMRREARTPLSIFNAGAIRVDDVLPAGRVTQYDVIRLLPFGGPVVRAELRGRLLRRVLDQGRRNAGSGGYLHSNAGPGPAGWAVGGAPIRDDAWYPVALPDYLLTGAEVGLAFLERRSADVRGATPLRDVRQALIDEMRVRWPAPRAPLPPPAR